MKFCVEWTYRNRKWTFDEKSWFFSIFWVKTFYSCVIWCPWYPLVTGLSIPRHDADDFMTDVGSKLFCVFCLFFVFLILLLIFFIFRFFVFFVFCFFWIDNEILRRMDLSKLKMDIWWKIVIFRHMLGKKPSIRV